MKKFATITLMAGVMMSSQAFADASVIHLFYEGDTLMFDKQTGSRACDISGSDKRDTCSKKGEKAYNMIFQVKGGNNNCELVGMRTQGQAKSLDYEGGLVKPQKLNKSTLQIKNANSHAEDITYEIVYRCNGVEKAWHPVLKNIPY